MAVVLVTNVIPHLLPQWWGSLLEWNSREVGKFTINQKSVGIEMETWVLMIQDFVV